ncbi:MAG: hypothetical protein ACSHX9_07500 [Luteolibacter sp.]
MNNRLLRIIVLLISITGAGAFVWFSSQQDKPSATTPPSEKTATQEGNEPSTVAEEEIAPAMLSSSKSAEVIGFESTKDLFDPAPPILLPSPEENTITDEEVRKRRNAMMGSSKIGRIISREDVRKILEKEAEEKASTVQPTAEQPEE